MRLENPPDRSDPALATWFAPARRASPQELAASIVAACGSPLVSTILKAVGCVVAVLNSERQILAVNDVLLRHLGVSDPATLLGLRPGEALGCIHATDEAGGCGTSQACSTCGAAIAILMAQTTREIHERECLISLRQGRDIAIELRARVVPMEVEGRNLLVLLLQDIRDEKRRQVLESVFFHDLRNTVTGLAGCTELLQNATPTQTSELLPMIQASVQQLLEEVESQRLLSLTEANEYRPVIVESSAAEILGEAASLLRGHRSAHGRTLRLVAPPPDLRLRTDAVLVRRILVNMGKNALESTPAGGEARMWLEPDDPDCVEWVVWNEAFIPPGIALRIFQRSFSTKNEKGRGLGTYGMRLLGERILGGTVTFTSSPSEGTTFRFRHARTLHVAAPAPDEPT